MTRSLHQRYEVRVLFLPFCLKIAIKINFKLYKGLLINEWKMFIMRQICRDLKDN